MPNLATVEQNNQLEESIIDKLTAKGSKRPLSDNTKQVYSTVAKQFNQFLLSNDLLLNEDSLRLFFDQIKDKYTASTLNLKKNALSKVIKAQVGSDSIIKQLAIDKVFEQVDTYKVDKAIAKEDCLSESQVIQLIKCSTEKTGLLIHFLYVTACRVSEAISIKLKNCNQGNGKVKIRIIGKGNKERFIYIPKELFIRIKSVYNGNPYLFESRTGKKLHRINVTKQIKNVGKKLELNISAHVLRHSRATDMLVQKGFSLKAVSRYLGHSSTAITSDMYIHDQIDTNKLFSMDSI